MPRPQPSDYPPFYETYVRLVPETDLKLAMQHSISDLRFHLSLISQEKAGYAYDTGKWTVRDLLQHCIDTERIFQYRALCIARGEKQSLPGFDENAYAANSHSDGRHLTDLKEEMLSVRHSGIHLYQSFSDHVLDIKGFSNGKEVTPRALGYIIIGHWKHHSNVLRDRYGIDE